MIGLIAPSAFGANLDYDDIIFTDIVECEPGNEIQQITSFQLKAKLNENEPDEQSKYSIELWHDYLGKTDAYTDRNPTEFTKYHKHIHTSQGTNFLYIFDSSVVLPIEYEELLEMKKQMNARQIQQHPELLESENPVLHWDEISIPGRFFDSRWSSEVPFPTTEINTAFRLILPETRYGINGEYAFNLLDEGEIIDQVKWSTHEDGRLGIKLLSHECSNFYTNEKFIIENPKQIETSSGKLLESDYTVFFYPMQESDFEPEKTTNSIYNEIKNDLLSPFNIFDNIKNNGEIENIVSDATKKISPERFSKIYESGSIRQEHFDITSSQFCGMMNSSNITTEEKQVFLEMCQSLLTLWKGKVSDVLTNVDKRLAVAEGKIDQMEIPDTEKNRLKSELNEEIKLGTKFMNDINSKLDLTNTQRMLDEHKQIREMSIQPEPEPEPEPTAAPVEAKSESKGGGCLIATAAFGSEMAPQVQFLRELRDNTVLQTQAGTTFMTGFNQFYYSFSPAVADYERENPVFKEAVKLSLTPLLTSLAILNYVDIDTEQEMLGYGIGVILLNIGMYFVAPAIVIISLKKRFKF